MAEEGKDFGAIGEEFSSRPGMNLYMNLPYLDVALCGLRFAPGDEGNALHRNRRPDPLLQRQLAGGAVPPVPGADQPGVPACDSPLHAAPPGQKAGVRQRSCGTLACDVAVESILSELEYPCLDEGTVPMKQKFFRASAARRCRCSPPGHLPVFAAAGSRRV